MSESSLIGKKLRFVLSNNFHYIGIVIDDNERELIIIDKKNSKVTINKNSIMIQEEVQNGS